MCKHVLWVFGLFPSGSLCGCVIRYLLSHSISPHLRLSGLWAGVILRGILMLPSRLPAWISSSIVLSLSLIHISVSVTLLLFLSFCPIFKAAHSCPLVFSALVNTTCQGVTFQSPLPPPSFQHLPQPSTYSTFPDTQTSSLPNYWIYLIPQLNMETFKRRHLLKDHFCHIKYS